MNTKELSQQVRKLVDAEKYEEALHLLNEELKENSSSAFLLAERGVVYFHQQKFEKAFLDMDACVALEPNNAFRYSSRAYMKASLNLHDEAILDYQKALEIDHENALVNNNLGLLYEELGDQKMSKKHFEISDDLEPNKREKQVSSPTQSANTKSDENQLVATSKWKVMKDVVTKKRVFKEYLSFLKKGMGSSKN